mmetsp:Transcript_1770/g.5013  ORF Transcript_1770/g.5013 Transcript_1770/m.5013 type:complete len:420 (-) Transcript_1770:607-1866(-)
MQRDARGLAHPRLVAGGAGPQRRRAHAVEQGRGHDPHRRGSLCGDALRRLRREEARRGPGPVPGPRAHHDGGQEPRRGGLRGRPEGQGPGRVAPVLEVGDGAGGIAEEAQLSGNFSGAPRARPRAQQRVARVHAAVLQVHREDPLQVLREAHHCGDDAHGLCRAAAQGRLPRCRVQGASRGHRDHRRGQAGGRHHPRRGHRRLQGAQHPAGQQPAQGLHRRVRGQQQQEHPPDHQRAAARRLRRARHRRGRCAHARGAGSLGHWPHVHQRRAQGADAIHVPRPERGAVCRVLRLVEGGQVAGGHSALHVVDGAPVGPRRGGWHRRGLHRGQELPFLQEAAGPFPSNRAGLHKLELFAHEHGQQPVDLEILQGPRHQARADLPLLPRREHGAVAQHHRPEDPRNSHEEAPRGRRRTHRHR